MNDFLSSMESITLSGADLVDMSAKLGNTEAGYVNYDDLDRYKTLAELMGSRVAVFVLMDVHTGKSAGRVGHWIALLHHKEKDTYAYYDPYGLGIAKDLALTHESDVIRKLLAPVKIDDNKFKHQAFLDGVNTCGRHCVVRGLFPHLSNGEYNKEVIRAGVPSHARSADDLVCLITSFLSKSDDIIRDYFSSR